MLEMTMLLAQAIANDFGRMGLGIGIGLTRGVRAADEKKDSDQEPRD